MVQLFQAQEPFSYKMSIKKTFFLLLFCYLKFNLILDVGFTLLVMFFIRLKFEVLHQYKFNLLVGLKYSKESFIGNNLWTGIVFTCGLVLYIQ